VLISLSESLLSASVTKSRTASVPIIPCVKARSRTGRNRSESVWRLKFAIVSWAGGRAIEVSRYSKCRRGPLRGCFPSKGLIWGAYCQSYCGPLGNRLCEREFDGPLLFARALKVCRIRRWAGHRILQQQTGPSTRHASRDTQADGFRSQVERGAESITVVGGMLQRCLGSV